MRSVNYDGDDDGDVCNSRRSWEQFHEHHNEQRRVKNKNWSKCRWGWDETDTIWRETSSPPAAAEEEEREEEKIVCKQRQFECGSSAT